MNFDEVPELVHGATAPSLVTTLKRLGVVEPLNPGETVTARVVRTAVNLPSIDKPTTIIIPGEAVLQLDWATGDIVNTGPQEVVDYLIQWTIEPRGEIAPRTSLFRVRRAQP